MAHLHRRSIEVSILILAALALGPLSLSAQRSALDNQGQVNISFTALDKDKHAVQTLRKEDIRVLEDGVPQEVVNFQRQTDQPLSLAILIDTSVSQERTLSGQKLAANAFIDSIIRPGKDQAAIITFAERTTLAQPLTGDLAQIHQAINRVEFVPPPGYIGYGQVATTARTQPPLPGSTAIWDAAWTISDDLLALTSEGPRRAIILLTDGQDTSSRKKISEAIERALKARIVIYAIGIGDEEFTGVDKGSLEKLSERTGGRAFFPKKVKDLQTVFDDIRQDLSSQYVVTYSPTGKKSYGKFRKVKIEITNPELRKQGIQLFYQQGYSASQ